MSGVFFLGGGRYLQVVEERLNETSPMQTNGFWTILGKVVHAWKIFKVVQETCFFWGVGFFFQNVGPGREKKVTW